MSNHTYTDAKYMARVATLEAEGCTTSDAQGIADAEEMVRGYACRNLERRVSKPTYRELAVALRLVNSALNEWNAREDGGEDNLQYAHRQVASLLLSIDKTSKAAGPDIRTEGAK